MSMLSKVSSFEVRRRTPGRVGTKPQRAWLAAKGATKGVTKGAKKGISRATSREEDGRWRKRAGIAAATGAAGGAVAYLRDPERRGKLVSGALSPLKKAQSPNDETIAERVRSEVFRPADAPKGSVNVNVEQGVVYLRGEVADQSQIPRLTAAAAAIPGVKRVESLLNVPGERSSSANGTSKVPSAS